MSTTLVSRSLEAAPAGGTSTSDVTADPVRRAVSAELALWNGTDPHPAVRRERRNAAVRDAMAAGYSADELAGVLSMRPSDIERIANEPHSHQSI